MDLFHELLYFRCYITKKKVGPHDGAFRKSGTVKGCSSLPSCPCKCFNEERKKRKVHKMTLSLSCLVTSKKNTYKMNVPLVHTTSISLIVTYKKDGQSFSSRRRLFGMISSPHLLVLQRHGMSAENQSELRDFFCALDPLTFFGHPFCL